MLVFDLEVSDVQRDPTAGSASELLKVFEGKGPVPLSFLRLPILQLFVNVRVEDSVLRIADIQCWAGMVHLEPNAGRVAIDREPVKR